MSERTFTYDELAAALNRSPDATRQLVRRRRWRRFVGNDGKARVVVPVDELETARSPDVPPPALEVEAPTTPPRSPDDSPDDTPDVAPTASDDARALIAFLEDRAAELGARVTRLEAEVDELRPRAGRADVIAAELEAERRRAAEITQAVADLKAERDKLLDRLLAPPPAPAGIFERLRKMIVG